MTVRAESAQARPRAPGTGWYARTPQEVFAAFGVDPGAGLSVERAARIPAEQLVVGDVVLISAGDQAGADGRIVEASALQLDESAPTGESVPVAKDPGTLTGSRPVPGDRTNRAFMNTPVTHGSGVLVVTATGAGTELGTISGMLSATEPVARRSRGT